MDWWISNSVFQLSSFLRPLQCPHYCPSTSCCILFTLMNETSGHLNSFTMGQQHVWRERNFLAKDHCFRFWRFWLSSRLLRTWPKTAQRPLGSQSNEVTKTTSLAKPWCPQTGHSPTPGCAFRSCPWISTTKSWQGMALAEPNTRRGCVSLSAENTVWLHKDRTMTPNYHSTPLWTPWGTLLLPFYSRHM